MKARIETAELMRRIEAGETFEEIGFEFQPEIVCPFCGEPGFDKPGLKYHLEEYCEGWRKVKRW